MKDLTRGRVGKNIFLFAVPMLVGNLFQQLYTFVDQIIVGRFLGTEALASVGASFPIIFTLIALIIGIASGGTIVISQFFGAKDYARVKRAIDTLFIILAGASVILTVIGISFAENIFRLIKLPEELLPTAKTYLTIYLSGLVVFFGFNGVAAVLQGLGDSITPLYFLILSTILNIALDLVFIVKLGWGIEGAAFATIIAQGVAFMTAALYLNKHHSLIKFNIKDFSFDGKIFIQSLRIGLPTGLQHTFVALGMMALMGIVNTFGTNVVAAFTAAGRIDSLAVIPSMVFAHALSTFAGQNLGAGKIRRVQAGLWRTLLMSSGIAAVMTILLIIFKTPLMSMFTTNEQVIQFGGDYLTIVTSFYLLFTTMFVFNGVMRGAGDTLVPMFITLFALWVIRIPAALFFSKETFTIFNWTLNGIGLGEAGIWWSIPCGWTAGMILSVIYYLKGNWKSRGVVDIKLEPATITR
ncbi:MAG TPA: MATE family efflux transporter [Bacteroidaceae bacterium]|nr:MATE family efflux transporter [Bacteroidaceae bacterium]